MATPELGKGMSQPNLTEAEVQEMQRSTAAAKGTLNIPLAGTLAALTLVFIIHLGLNGERIDNYTGEVLSIVKVSSDAFSTVITIATWYTGLLADISLFATAVLGAFHIWKNRFLTKLVALSSGLFTLTMVVHNLGLGSKLLERKFNQRNNAPRDQANISDDTLASVSMSYFVVIAMIAYLAVLYTSRTNDETGGKPTQNQDVRTPAVANAVLALVLFVMQAVYSEANYADDGRTDKLPAAQSNEATNALLDLSMYTGMAMTVASAMALLHASRETYPTKTVAFAASLVAVCFSLQSMGVAFKQWDLGNVCEGRASGVECDSPGPFQHVAGGLALIAVAFALWQVSSVFSSAPAGQAKEGGVLELIMLAVTLLFWILVVSLNAYISDERNGESDIETRLNIAAILLNGQLFVSTPLIFAAIFFALYHHKYNSVVTYNVLSGLLVMASFQAFLSFCFAGRMLDVDPATGVCADFANCAGLDDSAKGLGAMIILGTLSLLGWTGWVVFKTVRVAPDTGAQSVNLPA